MSENNRPNKPTFLDHLKEQIRKAKEQAEIRMAEMERQKKEGCQDERTERD